MELKQQLRLTQQLVMTPQLQQAIRLLQLSRLELQDEIRKELDDNPILAEEEAEGRGRESGDNPEGGGGEHRKSATPFEEDFGRDVYGERDVSVGCAERLFPGLDGSVARDLGLLGAAE